jgi:acyl-coenzyme A synthetase/AMP-(fatty) acid ligase
VCTSGSTGVPKAAIHLQHDIFTCIDNYARAVLGLTSDDILFSASKLFFAYGLGNSMFYPFGVGSTELLHILFSNRLGDVKPGSSGKIVPGYTARIVDDEGNDVPDEDVGTLLVKGESIAAFYCRHHDENNLIKPKAFVVLKSGYESGDELADEIKLFVKKSIAPYKFPRWVEFIKEMPILGFKR